MGWRIARNELIENLNLGKSQMRNFIAFVTLILVCSCNKPDYVKIDNGIIVNTSDSIIKKIKVEVFFDNVMHVSATPGDSFRTEESLTAINRDNNVDWSIIESEDEVTVKTNQIKAHVNVNNGKVVFTDLDDNQILKEPDGRSKYAKQYMLDGETKYEIRQVFDSPDNEVFYGLGQHQHRQMNYKGEDVELAQHNIVAVVPFLYSNKNYGILWDNYSITRFGDPRPYQQINGLKLYDKNGKQGGLSASYFQWGRPVLEKKENIIDYQNLDEAGKMPEILSGKNKVVWEGYIESDVTGKHKFLLYASEYFTLYINDEIVMDKWRQGWNPWSNKFMLDMEAGKRYKIKLEWKNMNGAYISLKYLTPFDKTEQQMLSLYSEVADEIDYYFIKGNNADEVISGYRQLTGKAPIMPKWALGLWQSRERYKTQNELLEVVREYRERKIPLDNIVLDWRYWEDPKWGAHTFDSARFPDPEGMIKELHDDLHARIMVSVWPKFNTGTEHFREMDEKGFLYKHLLTKKIVDWIGYYSTFYDAFNPDARKLFWEQMNEHLYSKGFDAWWLDATEPDMHSNFSVEERKLLMNPTALGSGAEYFNAFSLMNAKGVYEGQMEDDPDTRPFILTRSAFAGQQRYSAATWSGDVVTRWSNLKDQIAAGINFSLSGIPYWTTDIGGFSVENRYANKDPKHLPEWREINMRWYQFGAFCPLFRIHGQFPFREIFNISPAGSEVYNSMVYYDELRYRLMPYIYSLAGHAYHNNYTIMRGLVMDYPSDENVYEITDQYMFGPSLLVNPVTEFKAVERDMYLPALTGWYDLYTGKYLKGGQVIKAEAPLSKIPVFVPQGAIIPVGPVMQYVDEKKADPLTIFVYTGKDGRFILYEDDGLNNEYKENKYSEIEFVYSENDKALTILERKGQYPGMLENRVFNIAFINEGSSIGIDQKIENMIKVNYDGNKQTVSMK